MHSAEALDVNKLQPYCRRCEKYSRFPF